MPGPAKGTRWVTFVGIMVVFGGAASILDAIWAFRYDNTVVDVVFFEDSLTAWGWI